MDEEVHIDNTYVDEEPDSNVEEEHEDE